MLFASLILVAIYATAQTDGQANLDLAKKLLSHEHPAIRPVIDPEDRVEIHVQSALYQIVDLDQRNNLATIAAYFDLWWNDVYMNWNPADYNGTTETYLPSNQVWIPELYLYHGVQGSTPLFSQESAVQVHFTGKVRVFVPFTARALCPVNIKYFPLDQQSCTFAFGSWSYKSESLVYIVESEAVFLGDFYDNQEWLLINASLVGGLSRYQTKHHDETYAMVTMTLEIQRQSFYYIFNLVIPTTLVSLVSVVGIHAPGSSTGPRQTKFRLGIMTLLSMGVMLLMVVDEMPKFALASIPGQRGSFSAVPILALFYITLIANTSLATCINLIFVLLERYSLKHRKRTDIPRVIRWLDFDFCCKSKNDNEKGAPEKNAQINNNSLFTASPQLGKETETSPPNALHSTLYAAAASVGQRLSEMTRLLEEHAHHSKTAGSSNKIPEHWARVINRLEMTSLLLFLSVIVLSILGLYAPRVWY